MEAVKLSYSSTIPRHLVHRQSVGEVFLTDYQLSASREDRVAVQLPASHRIFRPIGKRHDPLIAAEAFRQSVILLCHNKYAVPSDFKFLMEQFAFEVVDELEVRSVPTPLVFDLNTARAASGASNACRLEVDGVLRDGSRILAKASAVTRCVTPESYRRIRAGRASHVAAIRNKPPGTAVIPSADVGRLEEQDVVLCRRGTESSVFFAPDPSNLALFDHPVDHIPGMVMFDAAVQAVRNRLSNPRLHLMRLSAQFPTFTEWDVPCLVDVQSHTSTAGEYSNFVVKFKQEDACTAHLDISVSSC
ncbi:ScbA/BarX family gamma-butyrolactone biosynthesis protein [Rhodococcoides yunnanense]|uniref:ScbA/BarX family gamma-butyrolactone biosynthesis protein n=1 Tax=Rhodococcoides yunnanense TaxID=278209 RepID=A0ABU4BI60_9NOCA|nr:ScbA/BarX family gamma-butyrolactone biosynthesis protein [Rhodococcus yunnanensis]MDV6263924.1 ScbA/BarX family gamma-butyrolactone biosynthesis protein [Rhodococcus yunnanensis]